MRFPTLTVRSCSRPVLSLVVEAPHGSRILVDALVDTGSDVTLLTPHAADLLQLDLTQCPEVGIQSALGTPGTYRRIELNLELRRPPDIYRWRTAVGVVSHRLTYCILGIQGFFEHFRMTYDAHHQWLDVEPSRPLPTQSTKIVDFHR